MELLYSGIIKGVWGCVGAVLVFWGFVMDIYKVFLGGAKGRGGKEGVRVNVNIKIYYMYIYI